MEQNEENDLQVSTNLSTPSGKSEEVMTRLECNALRGIAIIGIFLHNYCHWLNPVVKENEYQYFQHNVDWFHQVTASMDGLYPMHLLSYFGHYGVAIFLFLSAYGLERKYGKGGASRPVPFIKYHFLKLFKMMIVGFVAFTMVDATTPDPWDYNPLQIIAQLLMFNNVLPQPDQQIWPGPYWFFGLMLQLYIVYRLLLYRRHWAWTVVSMVVCVVLQMFLDPEGETINRYRYNFMGGMLPFGMGILFARFGTHVVKIFDTRAKNIAALLLMMALTIFWSENFIAWTFVPAVVCIGSIYFIKTIPQKGWLMNGILWMGGISATLFVCHPITRKIFIGISRDGDPYTGLLLYIVTSLFLAWLFKEVMKKIPNPKL